MPGATFLGGERVTLRTIESEDHAFVARNLNNPRVRRGFGSADPRTEEDVAEFLEERVDEDVRLLVCRDGEPVGDVFLNWIDDHHGTANLGYWIDPAHHREGYATEAAALLVEYAFDERRLARLDARAFATNAASRGVLESLGFQQEGVARKRHYVDGERVDMVEYGLLREEWDGRDAVV